MEHLVRAYIDAINDEDWDALRSLLSHDVHIRPANGRARRGIEEALPFWRRAYADMREHRDTIRRVLVGDGFAVADLWFDGRFADGTTVGFEAMDVFEFDGDRISRLTMWLNPRDAVPRHSRGSSMNIPDELIRWKDAWVAQDTELVLASSTPDVVYSDPYGVFTGHDALRKYCSAAFKRFVDWEMEFLTFLRDGDRMAVEWRFGMTSAQAPTAGRKVTFTGVGLVRIRDGKISEWRDNFDSAQIGRQLAGDER